MNYHPPQWTEKPHDFITTKELSEKYNISSVMLQNISRLLNIKKDTSGIYVYSKKDIERIDKFMLLRIS